VNNSPKIVFSKTLHNVEDKPNWKNIKFFHEINPEEIINLKARKAKISQYWAAVPSCNSLQNLGLNEYQLVIVPVILGAGKSLSKM